MKRTIRVEGDIAYVPLTQGYEAVIDAADVHLVKGHNWCADVRGHTIYAIRTDCSGHKKRKVYMHRSLMGDTAGLDIDHRDGDGLNNTRRNLRVATPTQNRCNSRARKDNTSGFKGVSWHRAKGKWHARIQMNGKNHNLGLHATPEAAHAAYAAASAEFHGAFGMATWRR